MPLALHGFGWRGALLMLMLFPLLAFIIWLPQWRRTRQANLSTSRTFHERGIWRSPLAWQVTLFLGINSLIYYVIIGWLPAMLISHGYSEAQAGTLHGLLQLATAAPGLVIPLILHRFNDQRRIAALVSLLCAAGAAGLWFAPAQAVIWTLLFGFGSGATMILGLTFIGLRGQFSTSGGSAFPAWRNRSDIYWRHVAHPLWENFMTPAGAGIFRYRGWQFWLSLWRFSAFTQDAIGRYRHK
ncbi:membrane protein [Salmonella bongori]|nr:membrane protein [Salmonella bongori]